MRSRRRHPDTSTILRGLAAAVLVALGASLAHAQLPDPPEAPPEAAAPISAWLTYRTSRTTTAGTGAYEGYSDALHASGRYDVRPDASALHVTASYRWRYDGERCEDGSEERQVDVALPDRLYVARTDLDDYDERTDGPFATWLWIPPTTAPGEHVRVLERDFVVVERSVVEAAGMGVEALHLRAEGSYVRDDAYGRFDATFVDEYGFDPSTGYFLRADYFERDVGAFEGAAAGFEVRETVALTAASHLGSAAPIRDEILSCDGRASDEPMGGGATSRRSSPGAAGLLASLGIGGFLMAGAFVLLGIFAIRWLFGRRRADVWIDGHRATVRDVRTVAELPAIQPADSPLFAPFLRHFVEVALAAGEKVAVVELADGRVAGLGIGDREANVMSVFARDGDACELLRSHLGQTELFTEHRHESLPSVLRAAQAARQGSPKAYNVLETYEVLVRRDPESVAYDASVVARMKDEDLADVGKLSMAVWGVPAGAWARAALAAGDVGFVVRVGGELVGYAFVSVCGSDARLYGNTVAEAHRGKGLGRELARARVATASALGATRMVTEVATWNVASLEVMRGVGFAKAATMWVESSAHVRIERKVVRR